MTQEFFTYLSPWSFCDRRCDRCMLSDECLVSEAKPSELLRFADLGLDYVVAALKVCALTPPSAVVRETAQIVRLIGIKCVRLSDPLQLDDDDYSDVHPPLLLCLIDELLRRADAVLLGLSIDRSADACTELVAARADLRNLLDAQIKRIAREDRAELKSMIAAGRAPSPFCIVS